MIQLVTFWHRTSKWNMGRSDFAACEWLSFMFKNGLRRLISSASMSSVSVLKRYFFDNAKFCFAGIASLQALH